MNAKKSLLGKYWYKKKINRDLISDLSSELGVSHFIATILSGRVNSIEQGKSFLDPKIKNLLPDPFHLVDMDTAVDRVVLAIKRKEKLCIFADYDVDGATSAALLKNVLSELGVVSEIYVPDRITEGYGPNQSTVHKIKYQILADLMIAVDCGTVAFEAINYAVEIDLDVIVIDHHIASEGLPPALAIVNPNRPDCTTEYRHLAAVGVTFLFVVALISRLKEEDFFIKHSLDIPDLINQLDIVALGTVCDVVKLTDINRAFVCQGLKIAKKFLNIGYKALYDVSKINDVISVYHLGFILGPRINAGGRVGESNLGATLLSTSSEHQAKSIARKLDQYNKQRKEIEDVILKEAIEIAETQSDTPVIFAVGYSWHQGVIGIIASKLKDIYNKPVIIISMDHDIGKASCRSVIGLDLGAKIMLAKSQNLVINGGGHKMAAGFTVKKENLLLLHNFFIDCCKRDLDSNANRLDSFYDTELSTNAVHMQLITEINKLEPYGTGNPAPIFKFKNLNIVKSSIIGKYHLYLLLKSNEDYTKLHVIGFNMINTPIASIVFCEKKVNISILGKLKLNKYNEKKSIQVELQDVILE
ncbi:single-stranded-DNA-specific exonuclease RecJ [Rickettsia endosymbiont of Cardiosporidium cionae]|uniref:single-stranded-DNA-specific exonuclease RecJ n=1 Tax=Rickettsia endosymbiont of Cardiosporidium cionae TaxID=2777155 RepID=UPI001893D313|nr:single-stranded-DNA-specific exonuclease RecJ [Rickettsia endosymbiont of Cardiosporidium cionae]